MYVRAKANGDADWLADARDVEHVLATLSEQPPGAVASTNPGLVYLRTHRKGVALAYADQNWEVWTAAGGASPGGSPVARTPYPGSKQRGITEDQTPPLDRQNVIVRN